MELGHPTKRSHHYTSLLYLYLVSSVALLSCSNPGAYEIHGNLTDRQALLEFKSKLDDPLGSLSSWNSSLHFCQWSGVTCGRKHRRVTALDLKSSKIAGTISPHIGNLSFLRTLNLRNNSFHSEIPPEVGRLFRLQALVLGNNSLGGEIPPSLSQCSNLIVIDLRYNTLGGNLSGELGSLSKLQWLEVRSNNLTGEIPPSFGNLSSIKVFDIQLNNIGGTIPESLGNLRNVVNLFVGDNNFHGSVPPSIFNISSIKTLNVAGNDLIGSLPWNLGNTLPNIQVLDMSENGISGPIPSSIHNASNLDILGLLRNSFTGSVPSLQNMRRLRFLQIAHNFLGNGREGDLDFLCSLKNSTALDYVSILDNLFGGTIPSCIGDLSVTTTELSLSFTSISGLLPSSIGNLVNLGALEIRGNNIVGTIPSEIGNLTKLSELYLSNNEFSGQIPKSIGNLKVLTLLSLTGNNLQGSIPSSLSYCQQLLALDLSDNELSGAIPPELMGLSSLSIYLDLSLNHLTGKIPDEVSRLQNLGALFLSDNRFSGQIPSGLGSCVVLEQLYLQDNLLEGSMPSALKSLKGITKLNLSSNRLSGQIPEFLGDLPLTSLDLSFNEFDGAIPKKGVFRNASAVSILGNKNLCGGLQEFHLSNCKAKEPEKNKRQKNLVRNIAIGSISGLLGFTVLIILVFIYQSKRQRKENISDEPEDVFPKVSYQSLQKATNGFSSDNLIGVGSFGSVFRGVLDVYEQCVAIKVLNLGKHGASKSFVAECEALRNIRHRNLVKVLTACSGTDYQGKDFKALIYEFMSNGSLDEWLHPVIINNDGAWKEDEMPTTSQLGLVRRLDIAIDVACALDYLHHQCEYPMIHCDLKPSNVLLDDDMTGHVGDFGLVRFVREATPEVITELMSSIGVKGSLGYIAPEYGAGGEISTFGDVYSYGILLLEIFTGKRPTDDIFTDGSTLRSFCEASLPQNVLQVVHHSLLRELQGSHSSLTNARIRGGFIKIQEECLASIIEVGVKCSSEQPRERMSMPNIVSALEAIKKKLLG